jgi:hypothetical protein
MYDCHLSYEDEDGMSETAVKSHSLVARLFDHRRSAQITPLIHTAVFQEHFSRL